MHNGAFELAGFFGRRNPPPIMSSKSGHPHFDDQGTMHWHTRFADALAQAKAEGKRVFIEFGREL